LRLTVKSPIKAFSPALPNCVVQIIINLLDEL